ncbi:hypothetical protein [Corynebacterium pseudogenitalium]|uniref:Tat pathway signal sequence domain protein n=1 Tax=Corynebacterium pseudogenitalium ATCC 33035 TaxID=525264 RepID=E2S1B5_9CORY|nr:hypothetical protein [Corynebacterium pseudogenitalium]EFQ81431.1 hypothetical protein HMPREF0305_10317 [Corynebacterium pseudogenitalium ATCC 33035]
MKLFSRKALVAGATALSMTFAGTTVATAAEEVTQNGETNSSSASDFFGNMSSDTTTDKDGNEVPKTSKQKADEAKAWIGVFTAVIGALGTLFAFASKYFDLPMGNK